MKRSLILVTALTLVLSGCAMRSVPGEAEDRAAVLQERYASAGSFRATFDISLCRDEEDALRYCFEAEQTATETRLRVLEPEELYGITAVVHREDGDSAALRLEFEDMVLDAGTAGGQVSALTAFPLLLHAAAHGYITERNTERYADADALRLCFETDYTAETLLCTVYFSADDTPIHAEIEQSGQILAKLTFTDFTFGDIMETEAEKTGESGT